MAVIIQSNPDNYVPSDNPVYWEFSSDQTAQPNFSYIVELYIDGALDSNHQIFPEVNEYAHFDAMEKISPVTPHVNTGQTTTIADAQNNREVYIKVFERYGNPESNQASATSATVNVFKAALSRQERTDWDPSEYTVANSSRKFLTRLTETISIKEKFDYYLSIITDDVASLELSVELFDSSGASIVSVLIPWPAAYKITQIRINTAFLTSETVISDPQIEITDTIKIKVVKLAVDFSETKTIKIDRECGDYGAHLIWLNSLGGMDQFNFRHNLSESSRVETKDFEKQYGEWQGNSFVLDASQSGVLDYFKKSMDDLEITTEWLTQPVQNWLARSVFEGVGVLIQETETTYTRIKIVGNTYILEQDRFTELFNVSLKARISNDRKSVKI